MKIMNNRLFGFLRLNFILLLTCCLFSTACDNREPGPANTNRSVATQLPETNKSMPSATSNKDSSNLGWTLIDSKRKKLSDYQGQVVILDLWATYCPPCLEGTPHLVNLQKTYGPQGLRVVGLNVGGEEDKSKIAGFIQQFNVQYDIGYPDEALVDFFIQGDDRIPQTIVLDRQGRVVQHFVGFNQEIGAKMEEAVKQALTTN